MLWSSECVSGHCYVVAKVFWVLACCSAVARVSEGLVKNNTHALCDIQICLVYDQVPPTMAYGTVLLILSSCSSKTQGLKT